MIKTGFWLAAGACRRLVLSPRMGAFVRSPGRKPWGAAHAKTAALFLDTSFSPLRPRQGRSRPPPRQAMPIPSTR